MDSNAQPKTAEQKALRSKFCRIEPRIRTVMGSRNSVLTLLLRIIRDKWWVCTSNSGLNIDEKFYG
jgi:hypothetical protein